MGFPESFLITCQRCGRSAPKRGTYQKYCVQCSEDASAERQRHWARDNPPKDGARLASLQTRTTNLRQRNIDAGLKISAESAENIGVCLSRPIGGKQIRISVPFSYAASKNAIYSLAKGGGHVFKRKASNAHRAEITARIRDAFEGEKIYQNKVWLDIFVQKPNHRGDAVNVVDLVCDAVKDALGIDDRWFSIRRLDWQITKTEPQLIIGIMQEDQYDAQSCHLCGRILALEMFSKAKHCRLGVGRECKDCRTVQKGAA